jgi:hypothetical protein
MCHAQPDQEVVCRLKGHTLSGAAGVQPEPVSRGPRKGHKASWPKKGCAGLNSVSH